MPGTKTKLPPLEETIAKATQMVNEPITSSDLTSSKGFAIPNVPPATQASGMMGEIASQADAFTQSQTEKRKQAEQQYKDSSNDIQSFLAQIQGKASLTNKAYDTAGVDKAETELKNINDQIRAEQRALDNRIRSIEEAGGGLQGGAEAEVNNVRRESLRKQADLYVIQQGLQGAYDSAKSIADRAVDAYLEQQKIESDARMFMYQENKDLFTKAEQREFEAMQANREREYRQEEAELKTISDISLDALQNGAPTQIAAQMRQAKTLAEAMEIGGQYVGALDRSMRQMQLAMLNKQYSLLGQPDEKQLKEEAQALKEAEASVPVLQDKVALIDTLKTHKGMKATVGVYGLGRFTPFTIDKAEQREFIGAIDKLTNGLTIQNLQAAKAQGATFGALSDAELKLLSDSATAINNWRLKDDTGRTIGYEIGETEFKAELDNIKRLTQKALIDSGKSLYSNEELLLLDEAFKAPSTFTPSAYYQ